ncbi:MAG: ChbG/HpnK family deacetylase, partial [Planctomycetota bacterium]
MKYRIWNEGRAMKRFKFLPVSFLLLSTIVAFSLVSISGRAAVEKKSDKGEIRLIVRGDDIGSCHAANVACIQSYRQGIMRAVEVMVP